MRNSEWRFLWTILRISLMGFVLLWVAGNIDGIVHFVNGIATALIGGDQTPATAAHPAAAQAPAAHPSTGGGQIDLGSLLLVVGIILGSGIASIVLGAVCVVGATRLRARRAARHANEVGWAELRSRKDQLMVEWSKYETDVALMIDYPVMTDYNDPVVHKVVKAMLKIRKAETMHPGNRTTPPEGSDLMEAVDEFELAFRAAEKHARRLGAVRLSPKDQRRLSTARQALNIILDGHSPRSEVDAAYKSLRSNLQGIIDLPQQAIAALESRNQLALDAA